ncbi:MAG: DegT/DnrJ/EryC1/StrS family aminotransferase [Muribaculaceae bacterium]|nr:DegT/DnrJ/EryC1/StrS family aminotransferase [Muribaculaceae bacterium]
MNVTSPLMPDFEAFTQLIAQLWDSRRITNSGSLHHALEKRLADYLGVPYISLFANGTLPLMVALKAFDLERGEVITTPYSFVATTHALHWSGMKPVFADIEPGHCTLSVEAAERAITPQTKAIMPVHVYGYPCDVDGFERLGRQYGLPIIYDAAHAFGVRLDGESLMLKGDLAAMSFHATKVFNTIEGGALICHSAEMKQKIDRLKNFGFAGETQIVGIGINAKLDELRSAWGLLNLEQIDRAIARRAELSQLYRELLGNHSLIRLLSPIEGLQYNYSHMPIFVAPEVRDSLYMALKKEGIYSRRYFYPLITDFEPYSDMLAHQADKANLIPNATAAAASVLCLPLYPELTPDHVSCICNCILNFLHK